MIKDTRFKQGTMCVVLQLKLSSSGLLDNRLVNKRLLNNRLLNNKMHNSLQLSSCQLRILLGLGAVLWVLEIELVVSSESVPLGLWLLY